MYIIIMYIIIMYIIVIIIYFLNIRGTFQTNTHYTLPPFSLCIHTYTGQDCFREQSIAICES